MTSRRRRRLAPGKIFGIFFAALTFAIFAGGVLRASSRGVRIAARPLVPRERPTKRVDIHLDPQRGALDVETAALAAAALEDALYDLPGVAPWLAAAPPRPALRRARALWPRWRLDLRARGGTGELELDARLCPPPGGRCRIFTAVGEAHHPGGAARTLARDLALELGVSQSSLRPIPMRPPSPDPYAVLLLGRSAATVMGLLPPPTPEQLGDPRLDPVARAVFVDPGMDLGWSLLARRAADPEAQTAALERIAAPSPGQLADHAAARSGAGRHEAAWRTWKGYAEGREDDPRFSPERAMAAARAGSTDELLNAMGALPSHLAVDPVVSVELEVALAERTGRVPDHLLAEWQRLVPDNPRPVRIRLERRLAAGRFVEALELTPALAARGAPEEAHRLTLALAAELGDRARAATAARALGQRELARRLDLRDRRDPLVLAGATSPELRLRRAERHLERLAPQHALEEVQAILTERPWWPEALDLERRAWLGMGNERRAAEAEARVLHADPLFYEDAP